MRTAISIASPPVETKIDFASDGGSVAFRLLARFEHRWREHPRVEVDDIVQGAPDRVRHARMVVADRRADLAGGDVEDLPPGGGLDEGAARAGNRLGPER